MAIDFGGEQSSLKSQMSQWIVPAVVLVGIIICLLLLLLLDMPALKAYNNTKEHVQRLKRVDSSIKTTLQNSINKLNRVKRDLNEEIKIIVSDSSRERDIAELIEEFDAVAKQLNLQFNTIRPKQAEELTWNLEGYKLKIRQTNLDCISTARFPDLINFIRSVEDSDLTIEVQMINVAGGKPDVEFQNNTLQVGLYRFTRMEGK